MLVLDLRKIGNNLLRIRKKQGLTQSAVAELASLSERTYADIERGTVNMRIETALSICQALHVTPDEILTQNELSLSTQQAELWERLNACNSQQRQTALHLLEVYLKSLNE